MPNEAVMTMVAELAADKVRERVMNEYGDIIHDAIGDAVLEVLGDGFDYDSESYMDMMMELCGRIVINAI